MCLCEWEKVIAGYDRGLVGSSAGRPISGRMVCGPRLGEDEAVRVVEEEMGTVDRPGVERGAEGGGDDAPDVIGGGGGKYPGDETGC